MMVRRGCGDRVQDGLYACVETSPFGRPIEYFLIDPPVLWKGACPLRSPMLVKDKRGIYHVIIGIGRKFYPFASDFIEEARWLGVSKRFPRDFDPSPLTPGESKLILMHPRGIPDFSFKLKKYECPKKIDEPHNCIGALWDLSSVKSFRKVHEVTEVDGRAKITTPSVTYTVDYPLEAPEWEMQRYLPALILQFPKWHFEYVSKRKVIPKQIKKRIVEAGFEIEVVEE